MVSGYRLKEKASETFGIELQKRSTQQNHAHSREQQAQRDGINAFLKFLIK